jgi:two-component system C4-dicarboxylate transport sensor histidine kinase DctB
MVLIYLVAAAIAVSLVVAAMLSNLGQIEGALKDQLRLGTEVRAEDLAKHLALLASELRRLGLRSEVDLLDENLDPERSLLRLSHNKSSLFNVGVAIIDVSGRVLWAEPQSLAPQGFSVAEEPFFQRLKLERVVRYVPVNPNFEKDSLLYVVSPIIRNNQFSGALLGAVDLASNAAVELKDTVLIDHELAVVYPPKPPAYSLEENWRRLARYTEPAVTSAVLAGREHIVAISSVQGTDLRLLSIVPTESIFGPARRRTRSQIALIIGLTLLPNLLLVLQLRRAFMALRRSEEAALVDERLRFLGEASNLIAHEVKNSLNSLRLGMDMILAGDKNSSPSRLKAAAGLRKEMERLSDFTSELLTFSRGITPRSVKLDLGRFVEEVTELARETAKEAGVALEIAVEGVPVEADPTLIHAVVSNLVVNAIEATAAADVQGPWVRVEVTTAAGNARMVVSDNGPGVPNAIRGRLFEPFVTGKPNGVGIGLALSRRIARAHGGDLVAEYDRPGAVFAMTLPLKPSS